MKKWFPWLMLIVFLAWALGGLAPRKEAGFQVREFGKLPVLLNGRIQPLDSVARNSLLQLRGKQTAPVKLHFSVWNADKRGKTMSASAWLLELFAKPEVADTRKIFRVDHPELIASLKLPGAAENAGEDDERPAPPVGKHLGRADYRVELKRPCRPADRSAAVRTVPARWQIDRHPEAYPIRSVTPSKSGRFAGYDCGLSNVDSAD